MSEYIRAQETILRDAVKYKRSVWLHSKVGCNGSKRKAALDNAKNELKQYRAFLADSKS